MRYSYLIKTIKFLLYLVPFTLVIVYQGSIFPFIVGKYVFFRTVLEIALVLFVWAWATGRFSFENGFAFKQMKDGAVEPSITPMQFISSPLVLAVGLFVFIFLLATLFGINPSASFWSNYERGEGSLQVLLLFVFFFLLVTLFRDYASWRRMFLVSIWAALAVIAYGLFGNAHIDNFISVSSADASFLNSFCYRFAGSLGNPAYLGTYMIFAVFFALYLFFTTKVSRRSRWLFFALALLFTLFLVVSQTRGALLGLALAFFSAMIYLAILLPRGLSKKIVIVLILISAIGGPLAIAYRHDINFLPFCPAEAGGGNRILDISTDAETYQTRLILWSQSIEAFKERPILGWGPENFSTAFEKYYDTRHIAWFDRAHNIFFDYLVFAGILGLASFLAIFFVFYRAFFKMRKKLDEVKEQFRKDEKNIPHNRELYVQALIFSLPIAYLVQGLVLFDVLPIYINIFLFLAFANYTLMRLSHSTYERHS